MINYKIKTLPLLIVISLLIILIRLGFWQLSRAEEKRFFLENQQKMMSKKPLPIAQLLEAEVVPRYQRVILQGHYDIQHQFLLDNQFYKGQVGYFILTPFVLETKGPVILVNRGWLLMDKNREILPSIDFLPELGSQSITGIINHFPEVGLVLEGSDDLGKAWPSVVQLINPKKVADKLKRPILDFQVQLSKDQLHGYTREWQVKVRIPPEKHIAYAFQWFSLAVTLLLLTFWVGYKTYKND